MRYRTLDENLDMTWGRGRENFLVNSPDCVAQAILTRLKLWTGEWFLDVTEGLPVKESIVGYGTAKSYDPAIRARILGTKGVAEIVDYSSAVIDRQLQVSATVTTIYGTTPIITASIPLAGG